MSKKIMKFRWNSTKWWILSTVTALLAWLKDQLRPNSVVIRIVNDGMQFISFLLFLHSKRVHKLAVANHAPLQSKTIKKKVKKKFRKE